MYSFGTPSRSNNPDKLTSCKHVISRLSSLDIQSQPQKTIVSILTTSHYDPQHYFQYYMRTELQFKNGDSKYSNFYEDEDEEEHPRAPNPEYSFYNIMCKNCWIDLSPNIDPLLLYITKYQDTYLSKPQKYIESYEAYTHWTFMRYLLQQQNLIRYIIEDKSLYKPFLDYLMNMIYFIHIKSNLHLSIQTGKPNNEPFPDIFDPKYVPKHAVITIPMIETANEGTQISREILNDFSFGSSYCLSTVYWRRKHFKYILKRRGFLKVIQNDFIKKCFNRCNDLHQFDRSSFQLEYMSGSVLADIMLWIIVFKRFVRKNKKYSIKKWCQFDAELIVHIMRFFIYPLTKTEYKYGNHNTIMKILESTVNTANVKQIVLRLVNNDIRMIYTFRDCLKAMVGLKETDTEYVHSKWIKNRSKEHFYENKLCVSPKCSYIQWKKNYNHQTELGEYSFAKIKFYKCSQCKIATYCSKYCQKIHWNFYNHRNQCKMFC